MTKKNLIDYKKAASESDRAIEDNSTLSSMGIMFPKMECHLDHGLLRDI